MFSEQTKRRFFRINGKLVTRTRVAQTRIGLGFPFDSAFQPEFFEPCDSTSNTFARRNIAYSSSERQNPLSQNVRWYCNDSVVAKSLGDLITAHQLEILRRLGQENNFDLRNESEILFGCHFDELSRPAAESFIEYLEKKSEKVGRTVRLFA